MDLAKNLHETIDRIVASGRIESAIEEAVEKAVISVLQDELRSYSDFGGHLKDAVKKSLDFDPAEIDLPSYNEQILKIVRAKVQGLTRASIESQVAEQMEHLLEPAPESINLSKLIGQFVEFVKERRRYDCVCHNEDSVSFHTSAGRDGFRYIQLDESPGKAVHQCDIQIGMHQHRVFSLTLRHVHTDRQLFAGPYYGFEKLLFQMKAAKTRIVFDVEPEEIDVEYLMETS